MNILPKPHPDAIRGSNEYSVNFNTPYCLTIEELKNDETFKNDIGELIQYLNDINPENDSDVVTSITFHWTLFYFFVDITFFIFDTKVEDEREVYTRRHFIEVAKD